MSDNFDPNPSFKRDIIAHVFEAVIVISCRVKKSGPFWTRFSVQRVVFSSRCPFFGPGGIFSHEVRGRKTPRDRNWTAGGKNTPEEQKKRGQNMYHFSKRGAENYLSFSSI